MPYDNYFYFDIEAIPTSDPEITDAIVEEITPPGNITKAETITAWYMDKKPELVKKAIQELVYDGGTGEIVTFACALGMNGKIHILQRKPGQSEVSLLMDINILFNQLLMHGTTQKSVTWSGHYITGFDLRFLWKRFVINRLKPAVRIPHDAKPWDKSVYDTCTEWKANSRDRGDMQFICKLLGIDGKDDLDGSKVWDYWKAGRVDEIAMYCGKDVERVIQIHKAMTFNL